MAEEELNGPEIPHSKWGDMSALEHIADVKSHQVAPAQLAVDGEIEQREFPGSMIQL